MNKETIKVILIPLTIIFFLSCIYLDATPIPNLHYDAWDGNLTGVKRELRKHDINTIDHRGRTPLHWAVEGNQLDMVKFLVENGADITYESGSTSSPLFFALREGNMEIFDYLLNNGAFIDDINEFFYWALRFGHINMINRLLIIGVDVNGEYFEGQTFIICATIGFYLPQNRPPTIDDMNKYEEIIYILVNNGVQLNTISDKSYTPLMYASKVGNKNIVNLLLKAGIDINVKNDDGKTALTFANEKNHTEIIDILKSHGAF